jgi:hypothetical protein
VACQASLCNWDTYNNSQCRRQLRLSRHASEAGVHAERSSQQGWIVSFSSYSQSSPKAASLSLSRLEEGRERGVFSLSRARNEKERGKRGEKRRKRGKEKKKRGNM